jgi:hypothetical protein
MGNYKLQMYIPDLRKQVCAFQKRVYHSFTWRHAAYLDWKHIRNPYLEEPLIYVALHDGQVVGMRALFGTCWEAGGSKGKIVLPSASDAGIEPEHRDSGLFEDLTSYVMDDLGKRDYSHVLNLSPTPSNYVVSVMTMGWRPMGSAGKMIREGNSMGSAVARAPCSSSKTMEAVREARINASRKIKKVLQVNGFVNLDRNVRSGKSPLSISRKPRPQSMAELVQQIGGDGRLRHVRDPAYFSWRFGNPRFCYRFLFWGGNNPDGYMVVQNKVGHSHVNIVDWEARTPQIRSDLLEAAIKLGQFRTMGTWGATLPGSAIEALQKAGFTYANATAGSSNGHEGRLMLKPLGPDVENSCILGRHPLEQDNWDLRMIYSDGG